MTVAGWVNRPWGSMDNHAAVVQELNRRATIRKMTNLRSHEPPRNSGEADAVDGPTALAGGDDANAEP